ncbi:MAG TPA: bifunctional (p)ppGpp synthetase/guanosine-3',5'-bis(diphosphate) 3'-pyrophosphohydrolase [Terriglobales bacterium]|jgi:GTP diphosphokinase / guanosine-3',5'-bis(diphosphate) 3'-diphosphatase|nr:bifunctional (p)ppGpp synthetase/guanosine-3',5'-bis(diphosphate) 3'-pyrophosphohydrolase [Terriglobales bacterium]
MATLREQIATTALHVTKYRELMRRMRENRPNDDLELIRKAYEFSQKHHAGQTRASGQPYLVHPLEVALVLAEMKMDPVAIAAGLLHDSVEDTSVTVVDIRKEFGEQVAHIVEGVTKISALDFVTREEQQAENLRKMMLAMVDDIRVVLIKLADRLHNMRTLEHLQPERQQKIARETLDIYAPIAHRLGMGKIRGELEDLGFRYVDPISYQQVDEAVEARRKAGEAFLGRVEQIFHDKLKEAGITAKVESRIKRLYSIHKKLQRQHIAVEQVYDLYAMRVITESVQDCYAVLGIIHNLWRPVPGRIKDFIAMPRPNFYQSLHTSVISEEGTPFEVQIRTEEMHKMAEEGIAAHWKYKDGPVSAQDEQRLAWLRQVVEWQRDVSDPGEFLSTLKIDLYPEEVYTFTPKGKVVVLPRDASPIDFAYSIHTEVGHSCVGAKVNGRMVPLRFKLHSGDIVEILTQPGHKPSRDWLGIAKSSRARNKIKHWLNLHQRERAIEIGRKLIEKEARKYRIALKEIKDDELLKIASDYGVGRPDDLMAGIGYGKFSARQVLARLAPAASEPVTEGEGEKSGGIASVVRRVFGGDHNNNAIRVKGHGDLLVYRARCCNPIRGESVVGYVTRGKGVAVHALNCPNVMNLMYEPERRIDVEWSRDDETPTSYPVKLTVYCDDRFGMLKQITAVISDTQTNIRNVEARTSNGQANVDVILDIADLKHLENIINGVRKIPGVHDVQRLQKV